MGYGARKHVLPAAGASAAVALQGSITFRALRTTPPGSRRAKRLGRNRRLVGTRADRATRPPAEAAPEGTALSRTRQPTDTQRTFTP